MKGLNGSPVTRTFGVDLGQFTAISGLFCLVSGPQKHFIIGQE